MFTIYHIPGRKYGCTNNMKKRAYWGKYDYYEIVEHHDDIMVASEREKELNLEAGYPWSDAQYYYKMVNNGRYGQTKRTYKKEQFEQMIETRRQRGNMSNGGKANISTTSEFDQKVLDYRAKTGMGQNPLAEKFGVSRMVIRRIIRDASTRI